MSRWLLVLGFGASALAFACDDETVEVVEKEVCYSGMRWVGDKRGSPEMFPGRDCVGCHIENDGPPLALGGTIYPYVLGPQSPGLLAAQSGTDCFGVEGIEIVIEDGDGQQYAVTTNRAGNFYVEGNPDDFAKPFSATITVINPFDGDPIVNPMNFRPQYGGCANCHNPAAEPFTPPGLEQGDVDDRTVQPAARIGINGYGTGEGGFDSISDELNYMGCVADESLRGERVCENLFEDYGPPPDSNVAP